MSKRSYETLRVQISNDWTPEPPSKRHRDCGVLSPDEGCFSASRQEACRRTSLPFDRDVDSLLCLQEHQGDDGYFSLSFEKQDAAQSPEELKLGPPIFESSALGEDQYLDEDNSSAWESTLPLQVQVKSVVVPVAPVVSPPEGATRPCLEREEEEKQKYISAVTRHMNENISNQDVMGELLSLMSEVASDSRGPQWQDPSDLTRRNYEKRFKPTPMTLRDYEQKLDLDYKRFANVPKVFRRSK